VGHFSAQTKVEGETLVVALSGDCDLGCRHELTAALQAALMTAPVVAVDLSGVQFLDSSGVHCLVVGYQKAIAEDKVLYATGATGIVAHVLDLTGMAGLLAPPSGGGR
jgi:anti-sigma B factor antagonist